MSLPGGEGLVTSTSVFLFLMGPAIVQFSDFYDNQAQQLQQSCQDAIYSLDQSPTPDYSRFNCQFDQP